MRPALTRRLQTLEQAMAPPAPLRVLVALINPDKTLHSFYADGRTFERQGYESDAEFEARVRTELDGSNCGGNEGAHG